MGRPLRLLNLALALVAVLIAGALAKTWVAPTHLMQSASISKPSQELAPVAFSRPARPPLAQFDILVEKNPFKQPPPAPVGRPGAPASPPQPLPILSGTILVDDKWWAILSEKGKAKIYAVGQEVAGGVITEIKEDRIMLERGDSTLEVLLKGAFEFAGSSPGLGPASGQPAFVGPSALGTPALGPDPGAAQFPGVDAASKRARKQEKQQQRQQGKSQGQRSKGR